MGNVSKTGARNEPGMVTKFLSLVPKPSLSNLAWHADGGARLMGNLLRSCLINYDGRIWKSGVMTSCENATAKPKKTTRSSAANMISLIQRKARKCWRQLQLRALSATKGSLSLSSLSLSPSPPL